MPPRRLSLSVIGFSGLAFFALAASPAPSAHAAGEEGAADLPPLSGPGQWLYVTQDKETTSSGCVGRPQTPLCAVETLLACFQRGVVDLCRLVDGDTEQYVQVFAAPADPLRYLAYRVLAARRLDAAEPPRDGLPDGQPGDVLLSLDQREGVMGQSAGGASAPASDFLLRRQPDGRWRLVGWGEQGESGP